MSEEPIKNVQRLSRALAVGYVGAGVLGLPTLLVFASPLVVVACLFPFYVGLVEGYLGRQFRLSGRRLWLRRMRLHQVVALVAGLVVLWLLRDLPLQPFLEDMPVALVQTLERTTAQLGMTAEGYLTLVWVACRWVLAMLFAGKQTWVIWRYSAALRSGSHSRTS